MGAKLRGPKPGERVAVSYSLDSPDCAATAQHTAGIAGLVLCAKWLEAHDHPGHVACRDLGPRGFTLEADTEGVKAIRDLLYEPTGVTITKDKQEVQIWLPGCRVIRDLDPSPSGAYLSLHQWGAFSTIYGRFQQRTEFNNRVPGGPGECSLREQWKLLMQPDLPVTVTSTLLWLANRQADGRHKEHLESGRMAFALQAKSLVSGFYPLSVPTDIKGVPCRQGAYWRQHGWVWVVPDICDLEGFVEGFRADCAQRFMYGHEEPRGLWHHIEEALCEYLSPGIRGSVNALDGTHIWQNSGHECVNGQLLRALPTEERREQYLRSRQTGEGNVLRWARAEASVTGQPTEELFAGALRYMAPEQTDSYFYRRDTKTLLREIERGTTMYKVKKAKIDVKKAWGVNIERVDRVDTVNIHIGPDEGGAHMSSEQAAGLPADGGNDGGGGDDGGKKGEKRDHPYADCTADPEKEPLLWLAYWVDQQTWRWLCNKSEQRSGGKWDDIRRDEDLRKGYSESRVKLADRVFHRLNRAGKKAFLNWFYAEALSAPLVGCQGRPMGPKDRVRFSRLLDTYWAEACRIVTMVLSSEKDKRSETTKNNDGLTTDREPK